MEFKLTIEEKSYYAHIAAGVVMGILCAFLGKGTPLVLLGFVVLYLFGLAFRRGLKLDKEQYNDKWWLGNGVFAYIMFWLFFWALGYYLLTQ